MSSRKPPPTIEESLRRMFAALDRADSTLSALFSHPPPPRTPQPPPARPPNPLRAVADHVAWEIHSSLERKRLKHERKMEKLRRREERRRRRRAAQQAGNPALGVVMMAAAGFTTYLALNGKPSWFFFVALGLFLGGISQFGRRHELPEDAQGSKEPGKTEVPAPTATEADEAKRVNELAKQLTKELEEGPAVLRQIVDKPAQTIDGLRKGYHAIADRERKLRALLSPEEDARLERDRASLVERRDSATDEVIRARYADALRALELQHREREELRTTANRLEAERTRLRFTLESLLAQVVRARSVHGLDASAGSDAALKQSLEQLTEEVGAVADAVAEISEAGGGGERQRVR